MKKTKILRFACLGFLAALAFFGLGCRRQGEPTPTQRPSPSEQPSPSVKPSPT